MVSNSAVLVTAILLALAGILVGARIYARGLVTRSFGPEDPLMVVSLLGAIAHQVGIILQIHQGLGDAPKIGADEADSPLAKWLFATILAYQATHLFLSLSIAYQYHRTLAQPPAKSFSLLLVVWLSFSGALGIGLVPLHCTPVQDFWRFDQEIQNGCQNYSVISFALAALNLANDLALIIGLCGVLILGFAAVVCSALRLSATSHIASPSAITFTSSQAVLLAISGSLELSFAIIAACLVTIEPLWPRVVRILHRRSTPTTTRALNSSLSGYRHQAHGSQSGQSVLLDELTPAGRARSRPGNDPAPSSREESPITSLPLTDSKIPRPYTSYTVNYSRPVPGPSSLHRDQAESGAGPSSLHRDQTESVAGPSNAADFVDIPLDTPPERPATPAEIVCSGIVVTTTTDIVFRSRAELGLELNDEDLSFGTTATYVAQGPASWQARRNYIHHFSIPRRRHD